MVTTLLLLLLATFSYAQQLPEGEACGSDSIPYKIIVDDTGKPG